MSYLSASPNVGYNGLPQLLLSDGNCASQYQMGTEATSAISEDTLHLYQDKDQTIITDQSCMEVEDNIFSSNLTLMNDGHVFHELDHEQLYNVGCMKQSDIPMRDKGDSMLLVNGTVNSVGANREAFLNTGHLIQHNNTRLILTSQEETNAIVKLAKSNKDSIKIRSKLNRTPAEQVMNKDCISAKVITVCSKIPNLKSPINTKKSIISVNEIRVKPKFATSNNKIPNISSSVQVIKWEGPEIEPATHPSEVNTALSLISTRKLSDSGTECSRVGRGRGPALHEALQRIVARPSHLTDSNDASSDSEDDVIPYFGMSFTSPAAELGTETSRGARLAARRATLRRVVARAAAGVRLLRPGTGRAARLARAVKKHAVENIAKGDSPRLSGDALDLLLTVKGISEVLTPRQRNKLRCCGGRLVGGGPCAWRGCGAASLPCAAHCLSHVTAAQEQRLYGSCSAVFAGGARCTAPVTLALATLCHEHAWKRDNYDRLSQEFKPKKSIDRKPKPMFGVADPFKKANKRRRSPIPEKKAGLLQPANVNQLSFTAENHPGYYRSGCEGTDHSQKTATAADSRVTSLGLPTNSLTSQSQDQNPVPAQLGLGISAPAPS